MGTENQALLSNRDGFTVFRFGKHTIRFRAPYSLERYTEIKEWDNGYIVVPLLDLRVTLAALMVVSMVPTAFAADQDYSLGTAVTITGAGGEYTVTVPAALAPGDTGTATAKGYWKGDETLVVTAPETVEVTDGKQKTTVNVDFDGIESLGNDLGEMNIPVSINIDDGGIMFGTWKGTIVYTVDLIEPTTNLITFAISNPNNIFSAEPGMTWADWVESDYNTDKDNPYGFKVADDKITTIGSGEYITNPDGTAVAPTDIILADTQSPTQMLN